MARSKQGIVKIAAPLNKPKKKIIKSGKHKRTIIKNKVYKIL